MRVVAAVIRNDGQVLACRRGGNHELAGMWEFPGGKVEPGETDEVALAREIQEELGIAIVIDEFIIKSSMPRGLGSIEMFSYYARLVGAVPTVSSDHDCMEWSEIEKLHTYDWAPLDIPVVMALQELP